MANLSEVAILAGGLGTRLAGRSGDIPKSMMPVAGKSVLQYQIELCRDHGFKDILLLVHHRHEYIKGYFKSGAEFGVNLRYVIDSGPNGTVGALHDALPELNDRFILLYGDTFMDVDLRHMWNSHIKVGASATLFLHPNDHPHDSDLVEIDENNFVRAILPYPHQADQSYRNLVNAALYVFDRRGLEGVTPLEGKKDIARDMFPKMLQLGRSLYGYVSSEYIKDMGTPERLDKVEQDFAAGLPEALSLRQLRSAVFLDRDGTVIKELNHLKSPDLVELLPNAGEAIQTLNRSGKLAVLTTNQPVVARGDITIEELGRIHARLETVLGAEGAYLDGVYYCPHHPDKGFVGEVAELKIVCNCRKPATGLIDRAAKDLNISLADSWLIGDTTSDMETGRRAGLRTILLRTGYAGGDGKYASTSDYTATDLLEAVRWICTGYFKARRSLAAVPLQILEGYRVVLIGGLARSGKSTAAQVLKELLLVYGKRAHIIPLDGWLKSGSTRGEGDGVLNRFDMIGAASQLKDLANSVCRNEFFAPTYNRKQREIFAQHARHSVGVEDILIIEGVPALYLSSLTTHSKTMKIYISSPESARRSRLAADYAWRGYSQEKTQAILESRELDETAFIQQSAASADLVVSWGEE